MHLSTWSPFETLPQELVDLIIDQAHGDPALLATCSLVCKAWFPAARHHLFSNTKLNAVNASSFINLISSTSSTISRFVRHIDVKDNPESGPWLVDGFSIFQSYSLPSVTLISLTSSYDIMSPSTLSALQTFGHLVDLRLAECEFGDFAHVQALINSFSVLESLYLEADWPEPHAITPTETSPSPYLREVYLRCEMSHVLEWFLMQPFVAPISKLTLHGLDTFEVPTITRYLQTLGSALTHLSIIPSGNVHDSLTDHLDLSFNVCLQYLKLAIDCDSDNLRMITALLSQLESARFEEAELSFYSIRQGPKVDSQWAELDALLAVPRFACMSRVTITAMAAAVLARDSLPLCENRGVLRTQRL